MNALRTEPISQDWTDKLVSVDSDHLSAPPEQVSSTATLAEVAMRLGHCDVDDLDDQQLVALAAAAEEVAHSSGLAWHVDGDPPVSLVRLIGTMAVRHPTFTGRYTQLLHDRLG
jgi:hypothetical protein